LPRPPPLRVGPVGRMPRILASILYGDGVVEVDAHVIEGSGEHFLCPTRSTRVYSSFISDQRAAPHVSKKAYLKQFTNKLYLKKFGDEAIGHALLVNQFPLLPPTSGLDITPLGGAAIKAVASIKNAADEMAIAAQQAQAIARNTKIAAVRAYEALRAYTVIVSRETPDYLEAKYEAEMELKDIHDSLKSPLMMPPMMKTPVPKSWTLKGYPATYKKNAPVVPGLEVEIPDDFDVNELVYLKDELQQAFANLKQASMDAVVQSDSMTKKYHEVQNASSAFTEALRLPGDPVAPSIPPVFTKPPQRPRDLAPFFLDVPYAISPGGDPYATHDGAPRDSMNQLKMGIPGFNPFEGTVPFSETGLSAFYPKVGHRMGLAQKVVDRFGPKMEGHSNRDVSEFKIFGNSAVKWNAVELAADPITKMKPLPPNDKAYAPFFDDGLTHGGMKQIVGLKSGIDVEISKVSKATQKKLLAKEVKNASLMKAATQVG